MEPAADAAGARPRGARGGAAGWSGRRAAPHAAHGDRTRHRGARRDGRTCELLAERGPGDRSVLRLRESRPRSGRAHGRARTRRPERDPPLPVRSRRRQPVECDEGAHGRRIAAGARHRADRARAAQGRPGPLRDRRRTARSGRRLDARDHRAGVRLRRVPHPLPGPDQVKEPMRQLIPAAFGALALVAPASAAAHVTIQPSTAPAGGFTRLDVRVPNERDDKGTIKVDVQMPPGFAFASYEPVPGWSVDITKEKLDKPMEVEGLELHERIARITWTGDPARGGIIEPGQFQDFGLSVGMPDGAPGSKLTFKAL